MNDLELKPGESIESLPASQADTLIGQAIALGLPVESLEHLIATTRPTGLRDCLELAQMGLDL